MMKGSMIFVPVYIGQKKRYPRILADESDLFSNEIHLKVGNEQSFF